MSSIDKNLYFGDRLNVALACPLPEPEKQLDLSRTWSDRLR
ncbi:hypothetical protein [Tolypothrix sp. FACHB-123]|nr:hypothetical protein [Tolypothrix sp. FACHB-123]